MSSEFQIPEKLNFFDFLEAEEDEYEILRHRIVTLQSCKYFKENDISQQQVLFNQTNRFSLIHHNVRSLVKNGHKFKDFLASAGITFSCILVTETWLKDTVPATDIPNYTFNSANRNERNGGGVGIYVHKHADYHVRPDLCCMGHSLESIAIEITRQDGKNIIVVCYYRPPDGNLKEACKTIQNVLDKLRHENKSIFLGGDFNVNMLNYANDPAVTQFMDILVTNYLYPVISRPTRISLTSNTMIDCIFTNYLGPALSGVVVETTVSDHFPILIICDLDGNQKHDNKQFSCRKFEKCRISQFNQALSDAFIGFQNIANPDQAVECFCYEIESRIDEFFPQKVNNRKRVPIKPRVTQDILNAINQKNQLYKNYLRTKTEEAHAIFNQYKNRVLIELRAAKKLYYQELIKKNEGDSKRTWQILKEMIGKESNRPVPIKEIIVNDSVASDPFVIATGLNDFFSTVGDKLNETIPHNDTDPTSYINVDIPATCYLIPVTPATIVNILSEMKGSGGGETPICAKVLKMLAVSIAAPLCHIVNLCFEEGYFPDKLKVSTVTPAYKSGSRNSAGNYRPISVLSPLSKIIERCVSDRILSFISAYDTLGSNQYGFRKKHSTEHALLNFVDFVTKEKEKGNFVLGIYVDIKKAFDSVNFPILYRKLQKYGIRGNALNIIKSYLTNRKQRVKIMDSEGRTFLSDLQNITCGVPQGSVLGPLLFLLYVNDLQNVSDAFHTITYADDTNLFISGSKLDVLSATANCELKKLKNWCECNRLCINISKSCFQLYTNKNFTDEPCIIINDIVLKREPTVKFLGVLVDEQLTFKPHIEYVAKKVSVGIGFMYRGKHLMDKKQLKLLYNSLVLPHYNYCSLVWGINFVTHLTRLILLQKRAARVILGLGYTEPVSHRFRELNLSPLFDLINMRCMLLIYKIYVGLTPVQMKHLIEWRDVDQDLPVVRNRGPLNIPFSYTRYKQNTFRVYGPKLFNRLHCISPITLRTSISKFKTQVRQLIENHLQ